MEHRLFEVAGEWAGSPTALDPAVRVHLDEVSIRCAEHAELWAERLPVLDGVDPELLSRPPSATVDRAFEALATEGQGITRLSGLYRVMVPRLLVTYDRHLARANPATDGPVIRVLGRVSTDHLDTWRAGMGLLQALLADSERVDEALAADGRLEAILATAHGPGFLRDLTSDSTL